jgi:hypothetical protein
VTKELSAPPVKESSFLKRPEKKSRCQQLVPVTWRPIIADGRSGSSNAADSRPAAIGLTISPANPAKSFLGTKTKISIILKKQLPDERWLQRLDKPLTWPGQAARRAAS